MQRTELPFYEAAILGRLIAPDQTRLSPGAIEGILALRFDQADQNRMRDLAAKAQAGTLTDEEQTEVEACSRVGNLLGILHSKARKALKGKRAVIRNAKTR